MFVVIVLIVWWVLQKHISKNPILKTRLLWLQFILPLFLVSATACYASSMTLTAEKEWLQGYERLKTSLQSGRSKSIGSPNSSCIAVLSVIHQFSFLYLLKYSMLAWRKQQLTGLEKFISENKNEIIECIVTDLGRY